jgi:mRNA interferase RelE/StbE
VEYRVIFSVQAQNLFTAIKDRREQSVILTRIEKLKFEPEKQGKALTEELSGYRSIRAVGQRYRVVYKVEQERVVVAIVGIGRRKDGDKRDVYAVTQDLISELGIELENGEV